MNKTILVCFISTSVLLYHTFCSSRMKPTRKDIFEMQFPLSCIAFLKSNLFGEIDIFAKEIVDPAYAFYIRLHT